MVILLAIIVLLFIVLVKYAIAPTNIIRPYIPMKSRKSYITDYRKSDHNPFGPRNSAQFVFVLDTRCPFCVLYKEKRPQYSKTFFFLPMKLQIIMN